jgi:hypothetical protein
MKHDEAKRRMAKKAHAYARLFNSEDGRIVLDDLNHLFGATSLKRGPDGHIDVHATIANAGCREVLLYMEQMRNYNATAE